MKTWPAYINQSTISNDIEGLISASHFGLVKIVGPDAVKLLQGQLTVDVEKLAGNKAQLAAHCQSKGRVISLFFIFKEHDDFYLFMPKSIIENAVNALQKYAVFYKVTIEDISNTAIPVIGMNHKPTTNLYAKLWGNLTLIIAAPNEIDQTEDPDQLWHQLLIQNGIASLTKETIEKFLPHELNLPALDAVSFDKGCFTGQEIIARMEYRGSSKKSLCLAKMNSVKSFSSCADIYDTNGKLSGILVDSANVDAGQILLVILKDTCINEDNFVEKTKLNNITPLIKK